MTGALRGRAVEGVREMVEAGQSPRVTLLLPPSLWHHRRPRLVVTPDLISVTGAWTRWRWSTREDLDSLVMHRGRHDAEWVLDCCHGDRVVARVRSSDVCQGFTPVPEIIAEVTGLPLTVSTDEPAPVWSVRERYEIKLARARRAAIVVAFVTTLTMVIVIKGFRPPIEVSMWVLLVSLVVNLPYMLSGFPEPSRFVYQPPLNPASKFRRSDRFLAVLRSRSRIALRGPRFHAMSLPRPPDLLSAVEARPNPDIKINRTAYIVLLGAYGNTVMQIDRSAWCPGDTVHDFCAALGVRWNPEPIKAGDGAYEECLSHRGIPRTIGGSSWNELNDYVIRSAVGGIGSVAVLAAFVYLRARGGDALAWTVLALGAVNLAIEIHAIYTAFVPRRAPRRARHPLPQPHRTRPTGTDR